MQINLTITWRYTSSQTCKDTFHTQFIITCRLDTQPHTNTLHSHTQSRTTHTLQPYTNTSPNHNTIHLFTDIWRYISQSLQTWSPPNTLYHLDLGYISKGLCMCIYLVKHIYMYIYLLDARSFTSMSLEPNAHEFTVTWFLAPCILNKETAVRVQGVPKFRTRLD